MELLAMMIIIWSY